MRRSHRTVDRLTNTILAIRSNPSRIMYPTHAPCTHAHTQPVGSYPTLSPPQRPLALPVVVPFWRLPHSPLPFLLFPTASMAHALRECEWEGSEMCAFFTWPEHS